MSDDKVFDGEVVDVEIVESVALVTALLASHAPLQALVQEAASTDLVLLVRDRDLVAMTPSRPDLPSGDTFACVVPEVERDELLREFIVMGKLTWRHFLLSRLPIPEPLLERGARRVLFVGRELRAFFFVIAGGDVRQEFLA